MSWHASPDNEWYSTQTSQKSMEDHIRNAKMTEEHEWPDVLDEVYASLSPCRQREVRACRAMSKQQREELYAEEDRLRAECAAMCSPLWESDKGRSKRGFRQAEKVQDDFAKRIEALYESYYKRALNE